MFAELGQFLLIVGLVAAIFQTVASAVSVLQNHELVARWSRRFAYIHSLSLLGSLIALALCFVTLDYSVVYVYQHANNVLPLQYRISAVWGGHEGSLLLWVFLLSAWGAALVWKSRQLPPLLLARMIAVMGAISIGFLLFVQLTSNPFARALPLFAIDGVDLNPLLQDPGLIIHPPLLYMGYVGFSVAFAFAVAGLWQGELDSLWARWAKPWTIAAWSFLTLGIALGSWWAYYELGWGGWWFWDPVENASLMPWLAGTALIHSMSVSEKRGAFKVWTIFLAISAFSLSLLGTFLVRSGVLTSVHAFANDPERGAFILGFLALVCGGSLLLFALRSHLLSSNIGFTLWSRESALLFNNLLLSFALAIVLIGTLAPIFAEMFEYKISVGAPYFNAFSVWLGLLLLLLLGPGANMNWKQSKLVKLKLRMQISLAVAAISAVLCAAMGYQPYIVVAMAVVAWTLSWMCGDVVNKLRNAKSLAQGVRNLGASYWGMQSAHMGLLVLVVGVVFVSHTDMEKNIRLAQGESYQWGDYRVELKRIADIRGPNYLATRADVYLYKNDELIEVLIPEKRNYQSGMPMTEASIRANLFRDVYVALADPFPDGSWAMRVYDKPLVRWLWLGALLMAIGGFLVMFDRRYRVEKLVDKLMSETGGQRS